MKNSNEQRSMNRKNKRRRKGHSLSFKASLILCLLVLFFAGVNSMTVMAGSDGRTVVSEKNLTKVYTPYTVKTGDTLKAIAKEYCDLDYYDSYEDYILEICNINHISSNKIYAGNRLTLPQYV